MVKYIIVPHGKRKTGCVNVTLKNNGTVKAKIRYDGKSKGYGSRNEDPFVRYKKAWFYSFCHTNESLNKSVRDMINSKKSDKENINFVFISPEDKKEDKWIIDTVIQLSKIIEIPKEIFNKGKKNKKKLAKIKMDDVVNVIFDNVKNMSISRDDVKNIIAKYHLPEFYKSYQPQKPSKQKRKKVLADNDHYEGEIYWSEVHNRRSSSIMFLGLADMNKSYFPLKKVDQNDIIYDGVKIEYPGLTNIIERNSNKTNSSNKNKWVRYHTVKLLEESSENSGLAQKLTDILEDEKIEKVYADNIQSCKNNLISFCDNGD